jgi:GNAT superfamily N-acetyltransferase
LLLQLILDQVAVRRPPTRAAALVIVFGGLSTLKRVADVMSASYRRNKLRLANDISTAVRISDRALDIPERRTGRIADRDADEAALIEELADRAVEIARIYAVKNSIGKGVGSALMNKCIEISRKRNYPLVWLGVWEHNHHAIDFYARWGFEKFAEHDFILGNDVQKDWLMKKQI